MDRSAVWLLALMLAALFTAARAAPAPAGLHSVTDTHAPASSALASRMTSHGDRSSRLPLPTPQELEALKKVAQILATLGQQVIPSIIGEAPAPGAPMEVPLD